MYKSQSPRIDLSMRLAHDLTLQIVLKYEEDDGEEKKGERVERRWIQYSRSRCSIAHYQWTGSNTLAVFFFSLVFFFFFLFLIFIVCWWNASISVAWKMAFFCYKCFSHTVWHEFIDSFRWYFAIEIERKKAIRCQTWIYHISDLSCADLSLHHISDFVAVNFFFFNDSNEVRRKKWKSVNKVRSTSQMATSLYFSL